MLKKTLTLLAFLCGAQKADAYSMFSNAKDEAADGLIELDMHMHHQPKEYLNDMGQFLMNLQQRGIGHNKHQAAYIEKDLYTFFDIQLYAEIWVGQHKEKFEMIFDTGSSWVWVQTDRCDHCMANTHKFHFQNSKSFHPLSNQISVLNYGKGSVFGFDSSDQVCIKKNGKKGDGCMSDYLIKSVVAQRDLEGLAGAGIIGLSPSSQGTIAQLFVPSLHKQGAIKSNVFAMYIDPNGQSKIQIGGYNVDKYAQGPLNWHPLSNTNFWQVKFDHVKLGNWMFKPSTQEAMADSGTSLNMMPDKDFHAIVDHFFSDWNCHVSPTTLTVCDCTREQHESIPDIEFLIGGRPYKINRDQWFERSAENNMCVIKFMHAPGRSTWILGLNFFTNYYTVFDYENMRIGFADSILMGGPPARSFMRWVLQVERVSKMIDSINKQSSSDNQVAGPDLDSWEVYAKVIAAEALALAFLATLYFGSSKLFDQCQKKFAAKKQVGAASDEFEVQRTEENNGELLSDQHFSQL